MSWRDKVAKIAVGDEVKYSRDWLKSTSTYTGEIPFAKGRVESIKDLGGLQIAMVDWGNPEIPSKVNVKNLVKVGTLEVDR